MSNQNRSPTRTPSIAIPSSTARSIDDILNINTLGGFDSPDATSMLPQTLRYRSDQPHSPSQTRAGSRSLYGPLESSRAPSAMRHASASSSLGSTRHPLGGGSGGLSGGMLGSRASSYSTRLGGASTINSFDPIASFEPRIIGGNSTSSETDGASSSMSPSRAAPRAGLQASRPRHLSQKDSHPSVNIIAPYGHHHILGSGAPQPFKRPTYLQYSFLRERLQTDLNQPETYSHPIMSTPGKSETKFDEHETHLARARPSDVDVDRKLSQAEMSSSSMHEESALYLPTRWSEDSMLKSLHISEDGRNLYFHGLAVLLSCQWYKTANTSGVTGPISPGEKEAAAARSDRPIPPSCGIYYFEVTILDKGQKGCASVSSMLSQQELNSYFQAH